MRLMELFDEDDASGGVVQEMRDAILDMLVPLAANGVPHVSLQSIIDKMREEHTGVIIDRALVMHVLDPKEVAMVTKIEGDTVFFKLSDEDSRKVSDDEEEKDQKHIKSTALKQAKKGVSDKTPPASPAPKAPAKAPAPKPAAGGDEGGAL